MLEDRPSPSTDQGTRYPARISDWDPYFGSLADASGSHGKTSRVSRLVIVLTLPVNEREGHLPYLPRVTTRPREPLWEDGPMTLDESEDGMPPRHRARASTGQRLLRRVGLATRRARLTVLEQQAARTAGLLTARTRQRLWCARYGRTRHVDAKEPGQLVCLDTFYIGRLKGVGKVWQITACDAASSYGLAGLLPAHDAAAAAAFLREVVVPHYRRAGWPVRRVLTDGGPEFQGAFDGACRQLGLRHTRTKPRHAWTNGFVERLQGTILQEHWRVVFRRRYFTTRAALQRTLDGFMRYYNNQRPHQGDAVPGRTPGGAG